MEQPVHEAAATKMLSIVQMCIQCPLQSAFYMTLYQFHRLRRQTAEIKRQRQKFEWWEFKMIKLIEDNELSDHTLDTVAPHMETQIEKWQHCTHSGDMLKALCSETQVEHSRIIGIIDALRSEPGQHLDSVQSLVQWDLATCLGGGRLRQCPTKTEVFSRCGGISGTAHFPGGCLAFGERSAHAWIMRESPSNPGDPGPQGNQGGSGEWRVMSHPPIILTSHPLK